METTEIKYKEVNGTYYHAETDQAIIDILERCRTSGTRIILDYGDVKTGQSWGEEHDINGYVNRSTGKRQIPILVYNERSMGGGAILDHCIIAIKESKGKRILYKHPTYKPAN